MRGRARAQINRGAKSAINRATHAAGLPGVAVELFQSTGEKLAASSLAAMADLTSLKFSSNLMAGLLRGVAGYGDDRVKPLRQLLSGYADNLRVSSLSFADAADQIDAAILATAPTTPDDEEQAAAHGSAGEANESDMT
jgi:hypothetical protein